MKDFIFIAVLVGFFGLVIGSGLIYQQMSTERIAERQKEVDTAFSKSEKPSSSTGQTELLSTHPKTPSKPYIGMSSTDFRNSCGKSDHISTYESARGNVTTYEYEFTEIRSKNDCWGRFTFRDYKLDSIAR